MTIAGICLVAFGVGGYFISSSDRNALETEILLRLHAQSVALASSLDYSLELLRRRTEDFASDGFIRTHLENILAIRFGGDASQNLFPVQRRLRKHLKENKLPLVDAFQDVSVHDVSGKKIVSARSEELHDSDAYLQRAFESDSIWFSNLVIEEDPEFFPALAISTPVWNMDHSQKLGYLVACVNVAKWISSSSLQFPVTDQTDQNQSVVFMLHDQLGQAVEFSFPHLAKASTPNRYHPKDGNIKLRVVSRDHASSDMNGTSVGRSVNQSGEEILGSSFPMSHNKWSINIEMNAANAMQPVARIQSRFLGTGLLIAMITGLILIFPIQFLIKPLSMMRDAARKISEGDFSARVQIDATDEIGDLARSFNVMADATQERTMKLEHTASLLEKRSNELRLERDLLNTVVHSMKDGLIYIDRFGNIVLYNEAATPLVELLKSSNRDINARLCSRDSRYGKDCLHCLANPLEPTTSCIVDFGEAAFEILATRMTSRDGVAGRILVSRDITERMRLDERQAHQERLAVLGEVSAVMAHELNNPLAAISMFNQMMEQEFPFDSPYREHIEVIKRNTDICKKTIRGLLDYSSGTQPEISDFDLHELLSEVIRFLKPVYEKSQITFELRLNLGNALLTSDEIYFRQVFVNLLLNAVQAMDQNGGRITIITSESDHSDDVVIDVIDSGPGIPREYQERIFESFFTSKRTGKGTGLGLPTSRRIVEAFGGSLILVLSEKGKTVFRVQLPRKARAGVWSRIPEEIQVASEH